MLHSKLIFQATSAISVLMPSALAESSMSDAECKQAGFNRAELLCSSCDILSNFDLRQLGDGCRACCKDDGSAEKRMFEKYPKAVLEVCG